MIVPAALDRLRSARRAFTVSDVMAVGMLLVICLGIAATLGASVILVDDDGQVQANFTFRHFDDGILIVTFARGDELAAGEVALQNSDANATWAEVAEVNDTYTIGQGDTIQLSQGSAFGARVSGQDSVTIRYLGGNQSIVLQTWNGSASG